MSRAQRRRLQLQSGFGTVRDMLLFFGGMAGIAHETLIASAERPFLLVVFAAACGLPAVLPHKSPTPALPPAPAAPEPAPEAPPVEGQGT